MRGVEPIDEVSEIIESCEFAEPRELKARWLAAWIRGGFGRACAECGVRYWTIANWGVNDPGFRDARAMADALAAELAEDRLRELADGSVSASTAQVTALTMRLRALRPERYGNGTQRVEVTGAGGGALRVEDGSASRAVELLTRFAAAARLQANPPAMLPPGGNDGTA